MNDDILDGEQEGTEQGEQSQTDMVTLPRAVVEQYLAQAEIWRKAEEARISQMGNTNIYTPPAPPPQPVDVSDEYVYTKKDVTKILEEIAPKYLAPIILRQNQADDTLVIQHLLQAGYRQEEIKAAYDELLQDGVNNHPQKYKFLVKNIEANPEYQKRKQELYLESNKDRIYRLGQEQAEMTGGQANMSSKTWKKSNDDRYFEEIFNAKLE